MMADSALACDLQVGRVVKLHGAHRCALQNDGSLGYLLRESAAGNSEQKKESSSI